MPQKIINLNNAKSGALLAKPVEDDKGRVLCREGTELTDKLILRFLRMGIENVTIKTDVFLSPEEVTKQKEQVNLRFSLISEKDPLLTDIKQICLEHIEKKAEKNDPPAID